MQYCYIKNEIVENDLSNYFISVRQYFESAYIDSVSVLLIGSLSRGEGSWIELNGKPSLISDIEFFIIYESEEIDKDTVTKKLDEIKNQVFGAESTNTFHVDFSFIRRDRLKWCEKKLIIFEAKEFGKIICGKDIRSLIPKVTISNINSFDIKDILNHRAFSILYYGKWSAERLTENEYQYILAKNGLDLLTVYMCMNGILEAGFVRRIQRFNELKSSNTLKNYFSVCAETKLKIMNPQFVDLTEMESLFLDTSMELNKNYKIRYRNIFMNLYHLMRRCLGILKRAFKTKTRIILPGKHFNRLVYALKNGCDEKTQTILCKEHYVLYGFPKM